MDDATQIVSQSIDLAKRTSEAWGTVWIQSLNHIDGGLWVGLVQLGLILATVSIVYVAVATGKEVIEKQSWSELVHMFIWPLVIMMFLGNNGALLSQTVLGIRNFAQSQVTGVLEVQLAQLSLQDAITQVGVTTAARQALDALYSQCIGLKGQELIDCWNSKKEPAQKIVAEAEKQAGFTLPTLTDLVTSLIKLPIDFGQSVVNGELASVILKNVAVPLIKVILVAIQWAFVNIMEAALLLTALFSPIAMGLSLLPLQGRPIFAWLIGYISLFGVQLGYNIVVGLAAVVIVRSGGELFTDVAFLAFLAIFAPGLAVLVAGGGGVVLYNGISNNVKSVIDFASSAVGALTNAVAKMV